jgi:hypothetical protein
VGGVPDHDDGDPDTVRRADRRQGA